MKFCDTTFSTEDMVFMLTKMMLLIQAETAGFFVVGKFPTDVHFKTSGFLTRGPTDTLLLFGRISCTITAIT